MTKSRNKFLLLLALLLLTFLVLLFFLEQDKSDGKLHVYFYDVGQGDAIHIRSPKGQDILVDGGPAADILQKLGAHMPYDDHTIELAILTHPHYDHLGGLLDVMDRYEIKKFASSGVLCPEDYCQSFYELLKDKNLTEECWQAGDSFILDELELQILSPIGGQCNKETKDYNNSSLVIRLQYKETSFLFAGDAEAEAEKKVIDSYSNDFSRLKSQVLKVGHHGSKTSSSESFIDVIAPEYAIISVGIDNKFNHPSPLTLDKFLARGAQIYRTDQNGDITIISDGEYLEIISENEQ